MNRKIKKVAIWVGLAAASVVVFYFLSGGNIWSVFTLMLMIGLHEYGHLLAAKLVGIPTGGFYFIPLGGVSFIKENPPEQWKKFIIAYGGPLTGLILCVLACGTLLIVKHNIIEMNIVTKITIWNMALPTIFLWSAINLFNLLPIYPFDGGRLLAAIHVNPGNRNGFEKFLLYVSWIFLVMVFIVTFSPVIVIVGFLFYRSIGRLEPNYIVSQPFGKKDVALGWALYLGLAGAFIGCLLVPFI